MPSRVLVLDYDGERVTFDVEGETSLGRAGRAARPGRQPRRAADRGPTPGSRSQPFLTPADYDRLVAGIQAILERRIAAAGLSVPAGFSMDRYHEVVTTDEAHRAVSDQGPWCYGLDDLPVPVDGRSAPGSARSWACACPPRLRTPSSPSTSASASSGPAAATTTRRTATSGSIGCATRSTSTCRSPAARRGRRCRSCAARTGGPSRRSSARSKARA